MDANVSTAEARGEGLPRLGARLRECRRRSGLTLEVAARLVELSPAHLSRLETAKRDPSMAVLLRLARAYSVPVEALLRDEVNAFGVVVRGADAKVRPTSRCTYRPAGASGRAMQALQVDIPWDSREGVLRVHPGEEWLYVLEGRLALTLNGERHLLGVGEFAHFDSMRPHRLAADTASGVGLLFMHTLLQSPTLGDL